MNLLLSIRAQTRATLLSNSPRAPSSTLSTTLPLGVVVVVLLLLAFVERLGDSEASLGPAADGADRHQDGGNRPGAAVGVRAHSLHVERRPRGRRRRRSRRRLRPPIVRRRPRRPRRSRRRRRRRRRRGRRLGRRRRRRRGRRRWRRRRRPQRVAPHFRRVLGRRRHLEAKRRPARVAHARLAPRPRVAQVQVLELREREARLARPRRRIQLRVHRLRELERRVVLIPVPVGDGDDALGFPAARNTTTSMPSSQRDFTQYSGPRSQSAGCGGDGAARRPPRRGGGCRRAPRTRPTSWRSSRHTAPRSHRCGARVVGSRHCRQTLRICAEPLAHDA